MLSIGEAERHQFVLTNMLEALKKGEPLASVIVRYNEIGLTDIEPEPALQPAEPLQLQPMAPAEKPAGLIRRLMRGLASLCEALIRNAILAAKAVSDRLKIKINPIVGATAGLPTLEFEFEYEAEFNVGEAWDVLRAILSGTIDVA
jgi:hypothetical protein